MLRGLEVARRGFLKKLAGFGGFTLCAMVLESHRAEADGMSQESVKYQVTPKGSERCNNCSLFVAGASKKSDGTCTAVSGAIKPQAWCMIWTPAN